MTKAKSLWRNRIVGYSDEEPDQLLANPSNWRIHPAAQQNALSGVLKEVGLVQNVVANRTTGHLVDGHLRVMLAMRENQPVVPVTWVELSEEEEHLILASLDPLAAMATADAGALDALLSSVQSSEAGVQAMLAELAEGAGLYAPQDDPQDAEPQIDRAEELRQKWGVEPGQLWRMASRTPGQEHRLICGDCTEAAVVERAMGGEKAAQTLTSPPYNVAANSSLENKDKYSLSRRKYVATVNDARDGDDYLALLQSFYDIAIANSQYVFINIQSVSGNKTEIVDFIHQNKSQYADVLVWDKGNAQPAMAHNVVNSRFEFVYVFSDKGTRAIGTKDFRGTVDNLIAIGSNQDKENSDIHKATFPVQFASFLIGRFTNESELVYEPFSGSGTTIIAAENLSRQCRACEISAPYVSVALQRYLDAFGIRAELIT